MPRVSQAFELSRRSALALSATIAIPHKITSGSATGSYSPISSAERISERLSVYSSAVRRLISTLAETEDFGVIVQNPDRMPMAEIDRLIDTLHADSIQLNIGSVTSNDTSLSLKPKLISGINDWIRQDNDKMEISGPIIFDEDISIQIPESVRFVDLRTATMIKPFGHAAMIDITYPSCSIVGGVYIQSENRKGYLDASVIRIRNTNDCSVAGATFYMNQGIAILVQDSNNVSVLHNKSISLNDTRPAVHSNIGHDILFWGSCNGCIVVGNQIKSQRGVGILFQIGENDKARMSTNGVLRNHVYGSREYGISLYTKQKPDAVSSFWNLVHGNNIGAINGDVLNPRAEGYIYGSGVYIQGVQKTIVSRNVVNEVCKYTTSYLLGPAAISAVNTSSVIIYSNEVQNSQWYGIYVKDTSSWDVDGVGGIVENSITDCKKGGVRVACANKIEIKSNKFSLDSGVEEILERERCG